MIMDGSFGELFRQTIDKIPEARATDIPASGLLHDSHLARYAADEGARAPALLGFGNRDMLTTIWRWFVVALLLTWAAVEALGDESILGLPTPRDPRFPGAVLLHGGGRITDEVFDRFVELAGDQRARIVLVPSAGYRAS